MSGIIDNASSLASIGNCLIVATPGGRVFSSDNEGTTWNDVSTGASSSLAAEALHTHANNMYAGMNVTTPGVWKRPLSEFSCGATGIKGAEGHNTMLQVYPNPSNGKFTVKTGNAGSYELTIYNLIGERVYHNANQYDVEAIDLTSYPKGMYWVKAGEQTSVAKVLIQ